MVRLPVALEKVTGAFAPAFATHELAHFAERHHSQLTLVSRFYGNSNLYAAPPTLAAKRMVDLV